MGREELGSKKDSQWKWALGASMEACPGARGKVAIYTGFTGDSRCPEFSPEAENCDDNDHQDQHHTHNHSACNQCQLLPPALIFWGRKNMIRRT